MSKQEKIHQYLLLLGDNSMILGHRLSELCGHGPSLETDIALTNISLDLFGQVRNYFQYAAKLSDEEKTEDDLAFLRYSHEYKNTLLVEQPNTDFAYIIGRQFLFDAHHLPLLQQLTDSQDAQIAAIAQKSIKEVRYHFRFSSEWVKRLGDGTAESHRRMQQAINDLWAYKEELFQATALELEMQEWGIGANLDILKAKYHDRVLPVLEEARLQVPDTQFFHFGGKKGIHSEHFGYILSDLQYMQRAYPNMAW
ncbi:MAG: 1,2-phenylacetyl-CoA epoxidase subunit PaaC [Bacteroidota bacterium]